MKYKYLEVETLSSLSNQKIIPETRIEANKATATSGYLRDIIWCSKYTKSKERRYKTCVQPILTYAVETKAEASTTKKIIRTTEMKTLGNIRDYRL